MEDPDELIPCPFEPIHMLQRKRMPYHIIKCRKVKTGIAPWKMQYLEPDRDIMNPLVPLL